ncbi:MAG TPA: hypothetical protein ENI23_04085 [bacterium]|nr:hypothetical protein [bacterium]
MPDFTLEEAVRERAGNKMRDVVAKWVYLAVKRRGLVAHLIKWLYQLQRWAVVPPKVFINLINVWLLPDLYNRGNSIWSREMFDKQLRESGL